MVSEISYKRRYTLPFISSTLGSYIDEDDMPRAQKVQSRRHQVYDYVIPEQQIKNERPFMTGRIPVSEEDAPKVPLSTSINVREILSDEEIENERPFMRGRVKVSKEVLKARMRAHWNFFKVLNDSEWENEKPFMHGRNDVPEQRQNFIQMAPTTTTLERENERPFMRGRNALRQSLTERRFQRRLVELMGEPQNEAVKAQRGAKKNRMRQGRRLCPPCQALNDFRKETLVPAVKSFHGLFTRRANTEYATQSSQWHVQENENAKHFPEREKPGEQSFYSQSDKTELLKTPVYKTKQGIVLGKYRQNLNED